MELDGVGGSGWDEDEWGGEGRSRRETGVLEGKEIRYREQYQRKRTIERAESRERNSLSTAETGNGDS